MEDDSRQETNNSLPTQPGLQEGASAPASWGPRAPAPVIAHGPSEGSV